MKFDLKNNVVNWAGTCPIFIINTVHIWSFNVYCNLLWVHCLSTPLYLPLKKRPKKRKKIIWRESMDNERRCSTCYIGWTIVSILFIIYFTYNYINMYIFDLMRVKYEGFISILRCWDIMWGQNRSGCSTYKIWPARQVIRLVRVASNLTLQRLS